MALAWLDDSSCSMESSRVHGRLGRSCRVVVALLASAAVAVRPHRLPAQQAQGLAAQQQQAVSRRDVGGLVAGFSALVGAAEPSSAYANAVPEAARYADRKKRRGPEPKDLGLKERPESDSEVAELKLCGGAPNCFCTTPDEFPEHTIPRWKAPPGAKREDLVAQLSKTLKSYPPGQGGIDGGGFEVVSEKDGYEYVRFESLKNGYVGDLELALTHTQPYELRVRSSSRVGFLDFEVNAKRLNKISADLRAAGWDAPQITPKTHGAYFAQNAER